MSFLPDSTQTGNDNKRGAGAATRIGADQVGLDADRADPHDAARNPGRSIAYLVKKFTSPR
jgi:hypothetical protein